MVIVKIYKRTITITTIVASFAKRRGFFSVSSDSALARVQQGRLMSWGTGPSGELGFGPNVPQLRTPRAIQALSRVAIRRVVAGAAHVLCVSLGGKVGKCYGWGYRGQGEWEGDMD